MLTNQISCNQPNSITKFNSSEAIKIEDFNTYISKFYTDSLFQQSRIVTPLEGEILSWDVNVDNVVKSGWLGNEPTVTDYEIIKVTMQSSIQKFDKSQDSIVEKIYMENSGFLMERTFKLSEGQWFLTRYNIKYL